MSRHRPSRPYRFPLLALLASAALAACAPGGKGAADAPAAADTWFQVPVGGADLEVQLALAPGEQQRGLMHRDALGPDQGMLFLFPAPRPQAFWMKNTRIPLDIGYFDAAGVLVEVHALYPYDETPVPSASGRIQIAVETNQGWYRSKGLRPGAQLDLEALEAAVNARGGDPGRYRLNREQP